jgi:hypothetical protein
MFDPARNARGGRIARGIQRLLAPFSTALVRRAKLVRFMSPDGRSQKSLIFRRRLIGVYDETTKSWRLSWPYSICLKPADLAFLIPPLS